MNFDFLKSLKLDSYFKIMILVGSVILVCSLIFDLKGISNQQGLLLGGAILSIGIGEWLNQKIEHAYKPPNAYTGPGMLLTKTSWSPSIPGLALDGLGVYLVVLFIRSF